MAPRPENRPVLTDPEVLEALAHPVRLDLLTHLMSSGPATASECAREIGDTPSNCSYHMRALARHGLVEPVSSSDGRERRWRATVTGLRVDSDADPKTPEGRGGAALMAASVALEQRGLRDYLSHRDRVSAQWREADQYSTYVLRITPAELSELGDQLDALIRPLIAATREDTPADAELVSVGVYGYPRRPEQ
jgi:DNA-binding transcriptional ArsR family regulator